jgi:hypothetical protein
LRLATGQLWKMKHAYVEIVELGKNLIRFRLMTSPREICERPIMSGIDTLARYLLARQAELVG